MTPEELATDVSKRIRISKDKVLLATDRSVRDAHEQVIGYIHDLFVQMVCDDDSFGGL